MSASSRAFAHRNAAREQTRVAAFGEKPFRVAVHADFAEKSVESGTPVHSLLLDHAVDLLRRHLRLWRAIRRASVAGAFDEVHARDRRESV